MNPHPNKLPTCLWGHLLIAGNLIKHGKSLTCRTCNVQACRGWYARQREPRKERGQ